MSRFAAPGSMQLEDRWGRLALLDHPWLHSPLKTYLESTTDTFDDAHLLPAQADAQNLARANTKQAEIGKGKISFQVAKVDSSTGEIAGTFESDQPSDTDMGAKEAVEVRLRGLFYGRIEPAQA